MVVKGNQNVILIQIDASNIAEFEISEFEISRVDCTCISTRIRNGISIHNYTSRLCETANDVALYTYCNLYRLRLCIKQNWITIDKAGV